MYDTLHFWLPVDRAGTYSPKRVSERLKGYTIHQQQDGQVYYSGMLENFRINISEHGISLKGSLPKYFLSNNFETLTRSDSARAIEKMADQLGLPVDRAKITRLDFGENFLMDFVPEAYYCYLGVSPYYKRLSQPNSVRWQNGSRTKLIYNKVAEAKAKGYALPDVLIGQNVLRYEVRYTRRLPKNLKQREITAEILSDEKFYMELVQRWIDEYKAINKLNQIWLNFDSMKSPKDFKNLVYLMGIKQIGQQRAMELVEEMRFRKTFEKPEYYSRLKKEIRELCKTHDLTSYPDLIEELDEKVNAVKRLLR